MTPSASFLGASRPKSCPSIRRILGGQVHQYGANIGGSPPNASLPLDSPLGGNKAGVTEHSGFLKNVPLNKFRKIPYIKRFFQLFSSFYAQSCNKIFNPHKIGRFFSKIPTFLKLFGACSAKNVSLNPSFPTNFQKVPFFGAFGSEKCVVERQICHPPLDVGPPISSLIMIILSS